MSAAFMLVDINAMFSQPELDALDAQAFMPGQSTSAAVSALKLEDAPFVREYLAAMPNAIVNAMMGAIHGALIADPRETVTLAYEEAPTYGVAVSSIAAPTTQARGAVTIVLTGPLTP